MLTYIIWQNALINEVFLEQLNCWKIWMKTKLLSSYLKFPESWFGWLYNNSKFQDNITANENPETKSDRIWFRAIPVCRWLFHYNVHSTVYPMYLLQCFSYLLLSMLIQCSFHNASVSVHSSMSSNISMKCSYLLFRYPFAQ